MKIPLQCLMCRYYLPRRREGCGPDGEVYPAECVKYAYFKKDCKELESKTK